MKNTKEGTEKLGLRAAMLLLIGLFGAWLFLLGWPNISYGQLYNGTYLVNTTVNITNSAPQITAVAIDSPINLNSYNTKTVYCNLSLYDYDNDTVDVKGILYLYGQTLPNNTNDGNNHYTNTSCSRIGNQDIYMNYTCGFDVQYFANNATQWLCNLTVSDGGKINASNNTGYATINPLVAIKMDPILDYGQLESGDTSNDTIANITNAGNRDANISVKGYGAAENDNLAFVCTYGTIALNYEKYFRTNGTAYVSMNVLTISNAMLDNYWVPQRVSETAESVNSTYWKIFIPAGAGGVCNGKILFTASDRGN
ncbi:MAG: hypothetical protein ABIJ34_03025 [archaeon]